MADSPPPSTHPGSPVLAAILKAKAAQERHERRIPVQLSLKGVK